VTQGCCKTIRCRSTSRRIFPESILFFAIARLSASLFKVALSRFAASGRLSSQMLMLFQKPFDGISGRAHATKEVVLV